MMSFLKHILKKEEERIVVSVDELDAWFDMQAMERLSGLDGAVQGFYDQINILLQQIRRYRDGLSYATLDMAENNVRVSGSRSRDNYCRDLSIFLNGISIPEDTDVMQSYAICRELMSHLDIFIEQTSSSFGVLRSLYITESESLRASISELQAILNGFSQFLQNKGVFVFSEIQSKIAELKRKKEKAERALIDINSKKARFLQAQKQRALKEQEITELRGSDVFSSYQKLCDKLTSLGMQRAFADKEAAELFHDILGAAPLGLTSDEALVFSRYTDNCAAALIHDEEMIILDIGAKLKNSGTSGHFREDKVHSLQSMLLSLIADTAHVRRLMEQNPVVSRLREEEYKLAHFVGQSDRFSKEISEMESTLGLQEINALRSHIELKIVDVLRVLVTISS